MLRCLVILVCGIQGLLACGREPSRLLRQGQLPIYDFPLYLTEGTAGRVWQIDRDRTKTLVAEGLNDPRGVAIDRFNHVYVAEFGAGRLLKLDNGGDYEVVREGLDGPSVLAIDSFGEVYVAQDGPRTIERASDGKVFGSYDSIPTALTFGVNDQPIVGLFNEDKVLYDWNGEVGSTEEVAAPINAAVDGTGRVYIAQGDAENGQVYRFHQRSPEGRKLVADGLIGPAGLAVDLVGNIFIVEQGAGRIVLISFDGNKYSWVTGLEDPQYLAFSQY